MSTLLASCHKSSGEDGYDAAVRLGGEWFNCDRLSDPRCEVALMHVPPIYVGDARTKEEQTMRRGFRLLRDRFGGISDVQVPSGDSPPIAAIVWESGTTEYWKAHRGSSTATFPVRFAKLSQGFVQIEVCRIDAQWEIKAVHFALPLSNASSAPMIESINAELSKVSQESSE